MEQKQDYRDFCKFLSILIMLSALMFPIVNAEVDVKALPLQDCPKGEIKCGWSNEGTSAIVECLDGFDWAIKQDCGRYGSCTIDKNANPYCEFNQEEIDKKITNDNSYISILIIGGAIILGLIIFAIILSRKKH